jgi:polyferredoxin
LHNHAPHIWAADFFTVQTLTFQTLFVFFFITHNRRRLVVGGQN